MDLFLLRDTFTFDASSEIENILIPGLDIFHSVDLRLISNVKLFRYLTFDMIGSSMFPPILLTLHTFFTVYKTKMSTYQLTSS